MNGESFKRKPVQFELDDELVSATAEPKVTNGTSAMPVAYIVRESLNPVPEALFYDEDKANEYVRWISDGSSHHYEIIVIDGIEGI